MRTVSVRLIDLNRVTINLGFVGENEHTRINIDCKKAFDEYPTAIPSLAVKNPHGDTYPAVTVRDGNYVQWDVANSDLVYDGDGEIQLAFTVDSVVARTYVGKTKIAPSIMPTGTAPSVIDNWIDEANNVLGEVREAIPDGGATGQVLGKLSDDDYDLGWIDQSGGGGGTSDYNELSNKPKIANITLSGNKSLSDLGIASASDLSAKYTKPNSGIPASDIASGVIPDVSGFYTKPSNGIPASDIADGVIPDITGKADKVSSAVNGHFAGLDSNGNLTDSGKSASDFGTYSKPSGGIPASDLASGVIPDPTSIIDDTAGDGDTSKVWSADKSYDEKSALMNALNGKVDKSAIDNAGITEKSYSTMFGGEFSVTTAATTGWLNPYARASVTGSVSKEYAYRVKFNGTEYDLPQRMWFENTKVYGYLGNLGLYVSDVSGVPGGTDNVPFIIISDLDNNGSIDVLTSEAGTYTIKVDEIHYTKKDIPKSLTYGDEYFPVEKHDNVGSTYSGLSMGVNKIDDNRGTMVFGYLNSVSNEFDKVLGEKNNVSGKFGIAIGYGNTVSGNNGIAVGNQCQATASKAYAEGDRTVSSNACSHAEGSITTASGEVAHAEGENTTASGISSHSEGYSSTASGESSHAEGNATTASALAAHSEGTATEATGSASHAQNISTLANGMGMTAIGKANVASSVYPAWTANTSYSIGDRVINASKGYKCIEANSDAEFTSSKWERVPTTCDTAFVIGNGVTSSSRSNAFKVDWDGNVSIAGNVYVGCGANSTGGTMLPTDVKVDGSSVLSNGVANLPIAVASDQNTPGLIRFGSGFISNATTKKTDVSGASSNGIKDGLNGVSFITPQRQHESTFFGLAKASGDTSQSSSSNAVGVYTDDAKDKIMKMIGIIDMIAPYESSGVASRIYSTGDCFVRGGKLYRAKTSIGIGESFSSTNCEQTTIIEEIAR